MIHQHSTILKKSSYDKANFLSKLFFCWFIDFFLRFRKKSLKLSDLEQCPQYDKSKRIGEKLEIQWKKELRNLKVGHQPSLGWSIIRAIGWHFSFTFIFLFIWRVMQILQTVCMGYLIEHLYEYNTKNERSHDVLRQIYLIAMAVVGLQILVDFTSNMYWFLARTYGVDVRVACSRLIYRKSLRLSQASLGKTTVGQIVNLLSSDVSRFDFASDYPCFFIVAPLEVIICIVILWPMLHTSILIGLMVLLLYIPFQAIMGKGFGKLRAKGAILTDERIRLMNEFIPALRVIKMYAWEKPLALLIDRARKKEISIIRWAAYLKGINFALGLVAENLIIFTTLVSFVLFGNQLTARTVFVAMSLIRQLQMSITVFTPLGISTTAESLVSIRRIREFILLPECEITVNLGQNIGSTRTKAPKIVYSGVTLTWNADKEPLLKNISFEVSPGKLLIILGHCGAGKTSILMSILGEMKPKEGTVEIVGSASYACQQSWIFAGTVKENILFGNDYNSTRYKRVIHVAALERDLEILPAGDQTVVGDRGASLSGGQKARINLARALYAEADIYLLDDPLSAVDASVAKHIFENSIRDFLSNKITILVTHQLHFIKSADLILFIHNGEQARFGDYKELVENCSDITAPDAESEELKVDPTTSEPSVPPSKSYLSPPDILGNIKAFNSKGTDNSSKTESSSAELDAEDADLYELAGIKIDKNLLWTYIRAGIALSLFPLWAICILGTGFMKSFVDYYLSLWADSTERKGRFQAEPFSNGTYEHQNFVDDLSQSDNISFFAYITILLLLWSFTKAFAFFSVCMRASIKLHNRFFQSIVRAPMSFFENTRSGIILNRASRDMGIVDDILPQKLSEIVMALSDNSGSLLLIAVVIPYLIIPSFILVASCFYIYSQIVNIARDSKRLEGVTKTPVYSHLANSLYGLTTIRAFRSQENFNDLFDSYQDEHTSAYFTWIVSIKFFIVLIIAVSVLFMLSVVNISLLAIDSLNGSLVGLLLTVTIYLSRNIRWGLNEWTEVETMLTSVERIEELHSIPTEGELESPVSSKPPSTWPINGTIVFCSVYLRYEKNKPYVLNNLNFKIEPREKVGIVGRTGAGKSSIMTALFRMTEPEGHILIDGIDIGNIGLHDLRRKISIIPQDPVIFTGSLRYNLDPFSVKSDAEIWKALDQAQLKTIVNSMGGLDAMLTDCGTNLSVGQRQLVCLARAILANNKILVLDEATANIDPTTDDMIQQTIRKRFADCTVLTIAHRLQTIIDSDKILVMDAGKVAQFGDPASLVNDKDGVFYSMIQATGKESAENLITIATRRNLIPEDASKIESES